MRSHARLLGHPIHQTLVVFPVGLLAASLAFDILALAGAPQVLSNVAYWTLSAGLVGSIIAAPFGIIDWLAIPAGTRAKRIGGWHAIGNALVILLFAVSWWLRVPDLPAPWLSIVVSALATGLTLLTAWLGGELVIRLGVGVEDDAHPDAPAPLPRGVNQQPPSPRKA